MRETLVQAIVIKSRSFGEADKMLTLASREQGRFCCVAKGVRTLKSTRRSSLESGNVIKAYLVNRKEQSGAYPILTQVELLADCESIRHDLGKIRQMVQFLEVVDKVMVQEELSGKIWQELLLIRQMIVAMIYPQAQIKEHLCGLLGLLGFTAASSEISVAAQVAEVTGNKLVGFDYLRVLA
ncbi:DNA repair protein RecO [Microgenomates group bacterium]|nr:DNA repair protein RecO [Microgenomates group bacterium]